MTAETRALEEMLFLARGVLCANLLAVDTLHGETLYRNTQNGFSYVSDGDEGVEILRNTHLIIFLGAKLDKRGVHLLVDGATHDEGSKSLQIHCTDK
jgi:hypothetical protein